MIWRPLLLDEALRVTAVAIGRPPQVLLADATFASSLELALDDPLSVHRCPEPGSADAYLDSVALNAARLIERLLFGASVPPPAADEILVCTLRRSRVQSNDVLDLIDAYVAGTVNEAQLASELRRELWLTPKLQTFIEDPADWEDLLERAEGIPRCRHLDERLFDPDDSEDRALRGAVPTLYLAHPITDTRRLAGQRSIDLESVRYQTQRACSVVLNALPAPLRVRLCHPGQHYRPPDAWDFEQARPLVERGIEIAHAFLYVGINELPLGMGGTYEIMRFLSHTGGQIAVAQPPDCPHSPVETMLLDSPLRITTAEPKDGAELALFVANWFADGFEETLAVQRRRLNTQLVSFPERDAAIALVKRASGRELARAMTVSGISPTQVERFLEHRHAMADVSAGQLSLFLKHLRTLPRKPPGRAPREIASTS